MKFILKHCTLRYYLRHVRNQNKHIQHVHAIVFAGIITSVIAGVILYAEYGFWHETYVVEDVLVVTDTHTINESVGYSWSSFFTEAKERFESIGTTGASLLEGKETYIKSSE